MNFIKKNWLLILVVLFVCLYMSSCTCTLIGGEEAVDAFLNGYVGEGPNPADVIGYPLACCLFLLGGVGFMSLFSGNFFMVLVLFLITILVG